MRRSRYCVGISQDDSRTAVADNMRFRDLLRFSLELLVPEKALLAVDRRASVAAEKQPEDYPCLTVSNVTEALDTSTAANATPLKRPMSESRLLIVELDSAQFGAPSFGDHSII